MPIKLLDIDEDDMDKVSSLIYHTDEGLFSILFGRDIAKAKRDIEKMVRIGNNSFGKENIYVCIDEEGIVQGLLIAYDGETKSKMDDEKAFRQVFPFRKVLWLGIIDAILLSRIVTNKFPKKELYISNVSVSAESRGKGFGTKLMNMAHGIAKDR